MYSMVVFLEMLLQFKSHPLPCVAGEGAQGCA